MKSILLLFALLSFAFTGNAATITGSVSINAPYSTHQTSWGTKVYLYDTLISPMTGRYIDSTYVNASGNYSFTVPSSTTTGSFRTAAWACNSAWNSSFYNYTGSNVSVSNISLNCTGPWIRDTIFNATTLLPVPGQIVYLLDSTATFYYKDSAVADASGVVWFFIPPIVTSGSLLIYTNSCGLQSQTVSYTGAVIYAPRMLICGTPTTVSGTLTNATTSAAIPYYRMYLTDSSASSILYQDSVFTDASGNYTFNIPKNISSGTMIVSTKACGMRFANRGTFSGSSQTLNLAACSSSSATISGLVYAWGGGSVGRPMYNKTVYILDSTATHYYLDSTLTAYDGHFSYNIPSRLTSGTLRVFTSEVVPFPSSVYVTYSGSSISNVWLQVAFRKYAVWGKTTLGGAPNNGPTKLYMILKAYDPILKDTTLTAIDSFNTIGNTGCFNKDIDSSACSVTNGVNSIIVKAALAPTHASYASYLPAYSYNSLNWNAASRIDSCDGIQYGSNYKMADIDLPAGVNPGGPGFIGGSVLLGANKSTAVGDPLSGRTLLLTTDLGQAVGFTKTDAAGQFKFAGLAYGNYLIFGDAWGKDNPPLAVNISAASPTAGNIVFEENSKSFTGHFNELAVNHSVNHSLVTLYPNPAHNYVMLSGLNAIGGDKSVIIRNITGAVLSKTFIHAGGSSMINTGDLPAGIYQLQVQSGTGVFNFKFVKN